MGGVGWVREPSRDLLTSAPGRMNEGLALAEGRIEAGIAERVAMFDTGRRHAARNGGELERKRRHRMRETGQRLRLEAFDVNLDEDRHAVARDQRIERGNRNPDGPGPGLSFPA